MYRRTTTLTLMVLLSIACDGPAPEQSSNRQVPRLAGEDQPTFVENPSVAQYLEVSIQRLDFIARHWRDHDAPPDAVAVQEFLGTVGWRRSDFMTFGNHRSADIASYIEAHPELKAQIDAASLRIQTAVEDTESKP